MKYFFVLILFLFTNQFVFPQKGDTIVVAFWNLENLFDTIDDPEKNDEDFTPNGENEWTEERLEKKMNSLAKVIRAMNNNRGPHALGVCESENETVFTQMVNKFLSDLDYQVVYKESPDARGIDCGFLFSKKYFSLLNVEADTVFLADRYHTRLILHVTLKSKNNDTLDFFINHWPSRRGGQERSEVNRITAAKTLKNMTIRLLKSRPNANIIIMGDFNDEPIDKSIIETLNAGPFECGKLNVHYDFSNLAYKRKAAGEGTFLFQSNWNMLDQFIVSNNILQSGKFIYVCDSFEIFKPEFIVTKTGKYQGAIFPTYSGKKYLGGYSDHYPVLAKFYSQRHK